MKQSIWQFPVAGKACNLKAGYLPTQLSSSKSLSFKSNQQLSISYPV